MSEWAEEDQVHFPENGELGYKVSYPLMLATLLVLSAGLVTTGLVLSSIEWVWDRLYSHRMRALDRKRILQPGSWNLELRARQRNWRALRFTEKP